MSNMPDLIAHRGYAAKYPENTVIAFTKAIIAGAQFIECDVQLSADQVPILFHDAGLARICGQPGAINDYPLTDLQKFHAALPDKFGNKFTEVPIATLQDLIDLLKQHPSVTAFVELKKNSLKHFGTDLVVSKVLDMLEEIKGQAVIISYDIDALYETRNAGWEQIGVVVDTWKETDSAAIIDLQPHYLFCNVNGLPANGTISFPGARIAVFEVDDPDLALELAARGVDMIETFAIKEMLTALKNAGRHG